MHHPEIRELQRIQKVMKKTVCTISCVLLYTVLYTVIKGCEGKRTNLCLFNVNEPLNDRALSEKKRYTYLRGI